MGQLSAKKSQGTGIGQIDEFRAYMSRDKDELQTKLGELSRSAVGIRLVTRANVLYQTYKTVPQ